MCLKDAGSPFSNSRLLNKAVPFPWQWAPLLLWRTSRFQIIEEDLGAWEAEKYLAYQNTLNGGSAALESDVIRTHRTHRCSPSAIQQRSPSGTTTGFSQSLPLHPVSNDLCIQLVGSRSFYGDHRIKFWPLAKLIFSPISCSPKYLVTVPRKTVDTTSLQLKTK